jgi:23S rRNA pseudouridine1911/1915/1917 synthase
MNIPIAYEDDWLVIADKPAGLLVIPTPKNESRTLTSILNEDLENRHLEYKLHPCHRLDRETSGLIIFAKGKSMQQKMMDLFSARNVKKTYLAFVQGALERPQGAINKPIEGRQAVTQYRLLQKKNNFSVVEIMLVTGRTNQIRIHFKQIGHPLVGETKFAFRKDFPLRAKRVCLHAQGLEFIHPVTGKRISVTSPMPQDLERFISTHG